MKLPGLVAAIGLLAFASCVHEVREAPHSPPALDLQTLRDAASRIVLCQTTEDELRRRLGTPYRDGRIAQGRILSWLPSPDSVSTHYLAVLLRPQGDSFIVVDDYFDVPSEILWVPTDRCPSQAR